MKEKLRGYGRACLPLLIKVRDFLMTPSAVMCILLLISAVAAKIEYDTTVASDKLVPIYSVDRQDKRISLTIDAAWGNQYTKEIVDILDKYGVRITFFTVDFWANDYPDDIRMLKLAGHEIGNHSATHPDMAKLSRDKMEQELLTTWETQKKLAGSSAVRLFRAPYGSYCNELIEVCNQNGFEVIQWSVDSLDWKEGQTADAVIERILDRTKAGSIILMHNNSDLITKVLPTVLEELIKQGYEFVPVSQLIYKNNFTIDANGVQHTTK
ncbi:MAG: polysaccharide deacetylase family protein [Clostridia bacterium]|nr:polysaccharide deacetylase family protein [Clostridia bacterium]